MEKLKMSFIIIGIFFSILAFIQSDSDLRYLVDDGIDVPFVEVSWKNSLNFSEMFNIY